MEMFRKSNNKGFTMVETILAMLLTAILFTASSVILNQGIASYTMVTDREGTLDEIRYGIDRMFREIQRIDQGEVSSIGATQIAFVDVLGNATDFHLTGNILYRGADKLMNNVTSLAITAYDSTGAVTIQAGSVRRVLLVLSATPDGQTDPITLRTAAFLRNYMYDTYQ